MTEHTPAEDDVTKEELRRELRQTRSRVRELEAELSETNEGMIALTLELEAAKERYQTIFEESTDGILLIDPDRDTIHEANPQACELLGYDHETLTSLSPEDIFPDETDTFHSFVEAVVHGWASDYTCRTKDHRRVDVDISASMITLDDRTLLLASLRDVTERKRRDQQIQVLTRIFRHNLRNDGNIIQGHADILHEALSDSDLKESARKIRGTIDEILQVSSKIRRLQNVLNRTQVNHRPIRDLLADRRNQLEEKYPEVTVTVSLPEQEAVVGRRLGMAVQEAVENAAKHADEPVTISLSVETDDARDLVQIDVEDDGPGVPEQELQVIRSGAETPQTHGSGIGFWFIYWVVDSLGGDLSIQPREPSGTVVSMTVPLETTRGSRGLQH